MLPLRYRDYDLFQSPYFFKKFKDRKVSIGYNHHTDFLIDFYEIFKNPSKSVIMKDTRPNDNDRYCDTLCIYKNGQTYIEVALKEFDGYFEIVNVMPSNLWLKDIYDKKEEIRKEQNLGA